LWLLIAALCAGASIAADIDRAAAAAAEKDIADDIRIDGVTQAKWKEVKGLQFDMSTALKMTIPVVAPILANPSADLIAKWLG
jgi:ribosomal protein L11 methylase PrmA